VEKLMQHFSKLIRFYDAQVTKTASSAQKEDSKDPQSEAEGENIVTYTGFGFSGWKSGLQRLFLTTKGTIAFSNLPMLTGSGIWCFCDPWIRGGKSPHPGRTSWIIFPRDW
jgi:hypothetical protein